MHPSTYYQATATEPFPRAPQLTERITADVCVVGGGYTGLSAALHLARRGVAVGLLEAESAGFGASGRNGGQIHTGLRKEQAELERWLGAGHARDLWTLCEDAKRLVRSLVEEYAVACELK